MPAAARYAPMAGQPEDAGDAQRARLNTADVAALIDEELEAGFGGDELDRLRSRAPRTAEERRRSDLMLSVEVQNVVASAAVRGAATAAVAGVGLLRAAENCPPTRNLSEQDSTPPKLEAPIAAVNCRRQKS